MEPRRDRERRRLVVRRIASSLWLVIVLTACSGTSHRAAPSTAPARSIRTTSTTAPSSIQIPAGWYRASQPLAPWLASPQEILSVATEPLSPSPLPGNQAACASEIPKVAVDAIRPDGAYLWIGEWTPGQGLYTSEPRPDGASNFHWRNQCSLPNGITASGATFRDQGRDFSVHMVLGRTAAARRAEIYAALDTLRLESD
jgi:hypothetical protein